MTITRGGSEPELLPTIREWWHDGLSRAGVLPTLRAFAKALWEFLRDSTPERKRQKYGDIDYDWDHRVNTTSAAVSWRSRLIGVFHSEYQPTDPEAFRAMLDALDLDLDKFVFLDLGSGKGRTLLMASDYPFRRIIGVELLPELHRIAQGNLLNYKKGSQKCFDLESVCADARDFVFPLEPLLVYLFNPFPPRILDQVLSNLENSLAQHPRPACVLYHNPLLADVLDARGWRKTSGNRTTAVYIPVGATTAILPNSSG